MQNIYCNPRLYIEDIGIIEDVNGDISFAGNNQIYQFNFNIKGSNLSESALMKKEVKFFLNYGSEDSTPFFIGYIQQVNATDVDTKITAYDSRCFLGGQYASKISITDEDNFDGYSIGQFIHKYVTDYINKDKEYIDLSLLNDTNPLVSMNGQRGSGVQPYSVITEAMSKALDNVDYLNTFDYELGVTFSNRGSSIFFIREKPKDKASMTFSYGDGIASYNFKKIPKPNRTMIDNIIVDYGGNESPRLSKDVTHMMGKDLDDKSPVELIGPALIRNSAFKQLTRARKETYNINIQATKGHYLQLGQVVRINVEEEIAGLHRLVSKKISFGPSGVKLQLGFNTRPLDINYY
jgi:hypothetical protein